jgi:site-specific recombinase XerD
MTPIAPHVSAFFNERLPLERNASPHTCDSYSYAFQLLLQFAGARLQVAPSALQLEQIDAPLVLDFLLHLERDRDNAPSSRNARLAAVKSFFNFVQYRVPSALEQVRRILAIPVKKTDSKLVACLDLDEMNAVLAVPDPQTREGIRDRAMLYLGFAEGLRVSEIVGLRMDHVSFDGTPVVHVLGKGRRHRVLPLTKDAAKALRAWLSVRGAALVPELFLNARGQQLTRSGFTYILRKHAAAAADRCPSLRKKRVSPHVLRHTCAMAMLRGTKDERKVALWLGHANDRTVNVYTRTDPTEKLESLATMAIPALRRGHFRPPDKLLALLKQARRYVEGTKGGGAIPALP